MKKIWLKKLPRFLLILLISLSTAFLQCACDYHFFAQSRKFNSSSSTVFLRARYRHSCHGDNESKDCGCGIQTKEKQLASVEVSKAVVFSFLPVPAFRLEKPVVSHEEHVTYHLLWSSPPPLRTVNLRC